MIVNNTSTQNKPTQGQWSCNFGNGTHLENDVTIRGNDGLTPIAEILNDPLDMGSPEWEEAAANARLIAAAPELLAALDRIQNDLCRVLNFEGNRISNVERDNLHAAIACAHSAIAKAEGAL